MSIDSLLGGADLIRCLCLSKRAESKSIKVEPRTSSLKKSAYEPSGEGEHLYLWVQNEISLG